MALTPMFLISAAAVERAALYFTSGRRKLNGIMILAAGILAGGYVFFASADQYFNRFAAGPGTKWPYNYQMYLAEKEIENHPGAVPLMEQHGESTMLASAAVFKYPRTR